MAIEQNAKRIGRLPRRRRPPTGAEGTLPQPELAVLPAQQIDSVVAALTAPEPYTPEVPAEPAEEKTPLGRMVTPELPPELSGRALDEAEAETERLRAQLAEVRKLLDAPFPRTAPPVDPAPPHPRRRAATVAGVLLAAGALGAGIAAVVTDGFGLQDGARPSGASTPGTAPTTTTGTTGTTGAATAPSTGAAAGTPAGLPADGPGVDRPGTALGVQLLSDRSIAVTEQAVLPAGTPESLTFVLHQPARGDLTGDAATLRPGVSDVRATVDGALAGVRQDGDRWTVDATGSGERRVVLSYRLTAAVGADADGGAATGRALGLVLPLTTKALDHLGTTVQLPADGVRNVVCAGATSDLALCATRTNTGWRADVPTSADSPAVLLQLDL